MDADRRIYVAGHPDLVGAALCRQLHLNGYRNFLLRPHVELELRDATAVQHFFGTEQA